LSVIARNRQVVVVHGVSAAMNQLATARAVPVRTLTSPSGHSSRYTDPVTRDLFVEAAGQVSDEIRERFGALGIPTVSVQDAIHGERKTAIRAVVDGRVRVVRDDYSGSIMGVDA